MPHLRASLKTVVDGIPAIGYPDSQPKETDTPGSSRTAARSTRPRTVPVQPWPGRFGHLAGYSELSVLALRAILERRIPSYVARLICKHTSDLSRYEMASAFMADRSRTVAIPGLEARLIDQATVDTGFRMGHDTYASSKSH
jgi:hypothetical protein